MAIADEMGVILRGAAKFRERVERSKLEPRLTRSPMRPLEPPAEAPPVHADVPQARPVASVLTFAPVKPASVMTDGLRELIAERTTKKRRAKSAHMRDFAAFAAAFTPLLCETIANASGPAAKRAKAQRIALRTFVRAFTRELCEAIAQADETRRVLAGELAGGRYYLPAVGEVVWSNAHVAAFERYGVRAASLCGDNGHGYWCVQTQQWIPGKAPEGAPIDMVGFSMPTPPGGRQRFMSSKSQGRKGGDWPRKAYGTRHATPRPVVPAQPHTYWPTRA